MSEAKPDTTPTTATPPAAKPAAPPPKAAPAAPPAAAAKPAPTPEERDNAERAAALLRARRQAEELDGLRKTHQATAAEVEKLRKELEAAKNGSTTAKDALAKRLREDPDGLFREFGVSPADVGKALLAKRGGAKQDPRDETIAQMRQRLEELDGWRKAQEEEREKRRKEEAERAEAELGERIVSQVGGYMASVMERWQGEGAPQTPEQKREAAGDELFFVGLREDPDGWRMRLRAYREQNPSHTAEDARKFYTAHLLRAWESRRSLSFVGALLTESGRTTDAPTDETGGGSRADAPRTITRKLSAARATEPAEKPESEMTLRERDEARKAEQRRLLARASKKVG